MSKITFCKVYLFFRNLCAAVFEDGKFLFVYIANEIPGFTSFPGFMTAMQTALNDGTKRAYIDLFIQFISAFAAAHRTAKVLDKTIDATKGNEKI